MLSQKIIVLLETRAIWSKTFFTEIGIGMMITMLVSRSRRTITRRTNKKLDVSVVCD